MIIFKKILLPTDFSSASHEALKTANDLAVHFAAELYVLHVIGDIPTLAVAASAGPGLVTSSGATMSFDVKSYKRELEKEARKNIHEEVGRYVSNELTARTIVGHGDAANEIVRVVNEKNIDLIVVPTHGSTGLKHFIFGSIAEKVVRTASCPVLSIRVYDED